jgi:ATP-dependent RNA helicase DeaD
METIRFQDVTLTKEVEKAISDMGFEEMTPIQALTIPPILEGKDIVGQAQTGTGKTIAFAIPIIEAVKQRSKRTHAIILCPTRELAIQVSEEIKRVAKYRKDVRVLPVYGGQPIDRQLRVLKEGAHIVIGTPGRTIDHINRGTLKLDSVKIVVLDEADEMLNMGFMEDVETILAAVPADRQTLLFSATMPKPILNVTKRYMKDAEFIKVAHKALTVPEVEQVYFEVRESLKPEALSRVIDMYNLKLALVFCNTKKKVDEVVQDLQGRGYLTEGLHGDMNQSQRDRVMEKFRKGAVDILVATDVAARGLDVRGIEAVVNYDVPQDEEYYVHRIGRTARAGKAGYAFTFVSGRETYKLREIQSYTHARIRREPIPTLTEVEESRSTAIIGKVREQIEEGDLDKYVAILEKLLREDFSSTDVAAALLKMMLVSSGGKEVDFQEQFTEPEPRKRVAAKLYLNVGRTHRVTAKDILGAVAGETGLPGNMIGKIEIHGDFTFVEVPQDYASEVIRKMKGRYIKGNKVTLGPAGEKK